MEGSVRDPVCCIESRDHSATLPVPEEREKKSGGDLDLVMAATLPTPHTASHWPETVWALGSSQTSAGNRFLYEFSQNAPHYPVPGSIKNQPDINLTNHFHLWRKQKTDLTDQFLCPAVKAIWGQSKVGQSAISGLSTELIITTGFGNIFQPLG